LFGVGGDFMSSTVIVSGHEIADITISGLSPNFVYDVYCAMNNVVTERQTVFLSRALAEPSSAYLGATAVEVSVAFSGRPGFRCAVTNKNDVFSVPLIDIIAGTHAHIQSVSALLIAKPDTSVSVKFTDLNPSIAYAVICVQGSFLDTALTASVHHEFTTLQASAKKYPSVLSGVFGNYVLVTSTYTSNGYAGCAAYVRGASTPAVSDVLNQMKLPSFAGRSIEMNVSSYSVQADPIIPRVNYDLYCAQDSTNAVEGPFEFSTPFVVSELSVSKISTLQVSLAVQFSKTAILRCVIYKAEENINPTDNVIMAGEHAVGQPSAAQQVSGYTTFEVDYTGLSPDTTYQAYCAQKGLVTRMVYFRTKPIRCKVLKPALQGSNPAIGLLRYKYSQPALRIVVAGAPQFERDASECSLRYRNSILLNLPRTFPQATGKERLFVQLGETKKEYSGEVYEESNRIDAVNALVFRNVDHSTTLVYPSFIEFEVRNIATPTRSGADGAWNVLFCDMEGLLVENVAISIPTYTPGMLKTNVLWSSHSTPKAESTAALVEVDLAKIDDLNSQFLTFNLGPTATGFPFQIPEFRVNWGAKHYGETRRTTHTFTETFSSTSSYIPGLHIRQVNTINKGRCGDMEIGKTVFPQNGDLIFSISSLSVADCVAKCNTFNCPTACTFNEDSTTCSCVQEKPIKLIDTVETQHATFCNVLQSTMTYGGSRGIWSIQEGVLRHTFVNSAVNPSVVVPGTFAFLSPKLWNHGMTTMIEFHFKTQKCDAVGILLGYTLGRAGYSSASSGGWDSVSTCRELFFPHKGWSSIYRKLPDFDLSETSLWHEAGEIEISLSVRSSHYVSVGLFSEQSKYTSAVTAHRRCISLDNTSFIIQTGGDWYVRQLSHANIKCCEDSTSACYSFATVADCESNITSTQCSSCFGVDTTDQGCDKVLHSESDDEYLMTEARKESMLEIAISKYDPRIARLADCRIVYLSDNNNTHACEIGYNISQANHPVTCEEALSNAAQLSVCRSVLTTKLEVWNGSMTADGSVLISSRNFYTDDGSGNLDANEFVDYRIKLSKPALKFQNIQTQSLKLQIYHNSIIVLQTEIDFSKIFTSMGVLGTDSTHVRSVCLEETTKPNYMLLFMDFIMSEGTLKLVEDGAPMWDFVVPIDSFEENQWHHFRLERDADSKYGSLQLNGKKLFWREITPQIDLADGGIGFFARGKNGVFEIDNVGVKSHGAEAFSTIALSDLGILEDENINISISNIPMQRRSGLWNIGAQTSYKMGIESTVPDVHQFLSKSYLSSTPVALTTLTGITAEAKSMVSVEPCSTSGFAGGYSTHAQLPPFRQFNESAITAAVWLKAARVDNDQPLFTLSTQQGNPSIALILNGAKLGMTWRSSPNGNVSYATSNQGLVEGLTWLHVAFVFTRLSSSIYVEGNLVSTLNVELPLPESGSVLWDKNTVGKTSQDMFTGPFEHGVESFTGEFKDFYLWNKMLTVEEIGKLLNQQPFADASSHRVGAFMTTFDVDNSTYFHKSIIEPNMKTKQSSTFSSADSSNAIDGAAYNGSFNEAKCSKTISSFVHEGSWWWVDLGEIMFIDRVAIAGRVDSCVGCIASVSNLNVRVGTTLGGTNGALNSLCSEHSFSAYSKGEVTINCNRRGRFISVHKAQGGLVLCEVKAFTLSEFENNFLLLSRQAVRKGNARNLAEGYGAATQSDTTSNAIKAIDNNHQTCSETEGNLTSWWAIDLKFAHNVDNIVLHGDHLSEFQLPGIILRVGNDRAMGGQNNPVCHFEGAIIGYDAIFRSSGSSCSGRFVSVHHSSTGTKLRLCEVEIYESNHVDNVIYGLHKYPKVLDDRFRGPFLNFEFIFRWPEYQSTNNIEHFVQKSNPWQNRKAAQNYVSLKPTGMGGQSFQGLKFSSRAGRSVFHSSDVNEGNSEETWFQVASNRSWQCGIRSIPSIEPLYVSELLVKRAFVSMSSADCDDINVAYRFVIVTESWVPDSVPETSQGSFIRVVFPAEFDSLSPDNMDFEILSGATTTNPKLTSEGSDNKIRLEGYRGMSAGRIEFQISGVANPSYPYTGETASFKVQFIHRCHEFQDVQCTSYNASARVNSPGYNDADLEQFEIIDEVSMGLTVKFLCDTPPLQSSSVETTSYTACCQNVHRNFEDGEDISYTFEFQTLSVIPSSGAIRIKFPGAFNWLSGLESVHPISGLAPSSDSLITAHEQNTILIKGFNKVEAESVVKLSINHVQNPPLQSHVLPPAKTYIADGSCIGNVPLSDSAGVSEEVCMNACESNPSCNYYSYCWPSDSGIIKDVWVQQQCKVTEGGQSLVVTSIASSGTDVGISRVKSDIIAGSRYCVDVTGTAAVGTLAFVWVKDYTGNKKYLLNQPGVTSLCFVANQAVEYGVLFDGPSIGSQFEITRISINKMEAGSYGCAAQHLQQRCMLFNKCEFPSAGLPKSSAANDKNKLSLCLLRNGWKNSSQLAQLQLSDMRDLLVSHLLAFGENVVENDESINTLISMCPSMVGAKLYSSKTNTIVRSTNGAGAFPNDLLQLHLHDHFTIETSSGVLFDSPTTETMWTRLSPGVFRGVNVSACAIVEISISAHDGSVVSWYVRPVQPISGYPTKRYGHTNGFYPSGKLSVTHKYCLPHGTYRFVALSTSGIGWSSKGFYGVTCRKFAHLGGQILLPESPLISTFNQDLTFSTAVCHRSPTYLYGVRSPEGKWQHVDWEVKRVIDASGVFDGILVEEDVYHKDKGVNHLVISPSVPSSFVRSKDPPLMFASDGFVVMDVETLANEMDFVAILDVDVESAAMVVGGEDHRIFDYNASLKQHEEEVGYNHGGIQLMRSVLSKAEATFAVAMTQGDFVTPVIAAFDNCAVVLSGKRVGINIDTESWVQNEVPFHVEETFLSGIIWSSYDSNNSLCSSKVAAPTLLTIEISPTDPSANTAVLAWTPGDSKCTDNGLIFLRWEVQMGTSPYDNFVTVPGCDTADRYTTLECTTTELIRDSYVAFRVRERCNLELASGNWKRVYRQTFSPRAGSPTSFLAEPYGHQSMYLSWVPSTTSCASAASVFQRWEINIGVVGEENSFLGPSGCTCLTNRSFSSCNAVNLQSETQYSFQVREVCMTDDEIAAPFRSGIFVTTITAQTLSGRASPPEIFFGETNVSSTFIDVRWVPNSIGCVEAGSSFSRWIVEYLDISIPGTVYLPASNCASSNLPRTAGNECILAGLQPHHSYIVKIREMCTDSTRASAPQYSDAHATWGSSAGRPIELRSGSAARPSDGVVSVTGIHRISTGILRLEISSVHDFKKGDTVALEGITSNRSVAIDKVSEIVVTSLCLQSSDLQHVSDSKVVLNAEFCDEDAFKRCVILPVASTYPTAEQIFAGLDSSGVNASFRSNLQQSTNINVGGLNPNTEYNAHCAMLNGNGDFISNEKVAFHTAFQNSISEQPRIVQLTASLLIVRVTFSTSGLARCIIVPSDTLVEDASFVMDGTNGAIKGAPPASAMASHGDPFEVTYDISSPITDAGTQYGVFCAQSAVLSGKTAFVAPFIISPVNLLANYVHNGLVYATLSVHFSSTNESNCIISTSGTYVSATAVGSCSSSGVLHPSVPHIHTCFGLSTSDLYFAHCVQNGIVTTSIQFGALSANKSPKLSNLSAAPILKKTVAKRIDKTSVELVTTFSGSGNSRCVVTLPTSSNNIRASSILDGSALGVVGTPPVSTEVEAGIALTVVYPGLNKGTEYEAYCAQNGVLGNKVAFVTASDNSIIVPPKITNNQGDKVEITVVFATTGMARCCVRRIENPPSVPSATDIYSDTSGMAYAGNLPPLQSATGGDAFVQVVQGLAPGTTYEAYCAQNNVLGSRLTFRTRPQSLAVDNIVKQPSLIAAGSFWAKVTVAFTETGNARCAILKRAIGDAEPSATQVLGGDLDESGAHIPKIHAFGGSSVNFTFVGLSPGTSYVVYCALDNGNSNFPLTQALNIETSSILTRPELVQYDDGVAIISVTFSKGGVARCAVVHFDNVVRPNPSDILNGAVSGSVGNSSSAIWARGGVPQTFRHSDLTSGRLYKVYCALGDLVTSEVQFYSSSVRESAHVHEYGSSSVTTKVIFGANESSRCIVLPSGSPVPNSEHIVKGLNIFGTQTAHLTSLDTRYTKTVSGLSENTNYDVHCAQPLTVSSFTFQTAPQNILTSDLVPSDAKGTSVKLSITFSSTGTYSCAVVTKGSTATAANILDGTVGGKIGAGATGTAVGGASVDLVYNNLFPGSIYDAYCAQGSLLSNQASFETDAILKPLKLEKFYDAEPRVSITFLKAGFVRCVALETAAASPTIDTILSGNVASPKSYPVGSNVHAGVPYNVGFVSLQKGTNYNIYCAKDGIRSETLTIVVSEIVSPCKVVQQSLNTVKIQSTYSGSGTVKCIVHQDDDTNLNNTEVYEGLLPGVRGVVPAASSNIAETPHVVVYGGLAPNKWYRAMCAQQGAFQVSEQRFFLDPEFSDLDNIVITDIYSNSVNFKYKFSLPGISRCVVVTGKPSIDLIESSQIIYGPMANIQGLPANYSAVSSHTNYDISYGGLSANTEYEIFCAVESTVVRCKNMFRTSHIITHTAFIHSFINPLSVDVGVQVAVTFGKAGLARCVVLPTESPAPSNAGLILNDDVANSQGNPSSKKWAYSDVPFISDHTGLVVGHAYRAHCAQGDLISTSIKYLIIGGINMQTKIIEVGPRHVRLETRFTAAGSARCVLLTKGSNVPTTDQILQGYNAVGVSPFPILLISNQSYVVLYEGLQPGAKYDAYCAMRNVTTERLRVQTSSIRTPLRIFEKTGKSVTIVVSFTCAGITRCAVVAAGSISPKASDILSGVAIDAFYSAPINVSANSVAIHKIASPLMVPRNEYDAYCATAGILTGAKRLSTSGGRLHVRTNGVHSFRGGQSVSFGSYSGPLPLKTGVFRVSRQTGSIPNGLSLSTLVDYIPAEAWGTKSMGHVQRVTEESNLHGLTVVCDSNCNERLSWPHSAYIDVQVGMFSSLSCCNSGCEQYCDLSWGTLRPAGNKFRNILSVSWRENKYDTCAKSGSTFSRWDVHYKRLEDGANSYTAAPGCTNLVSLPDTFCDVDGLSASSWYSFRVKMICADSTSFDENTGGNVVLPLDSPWSEDSEYSFAQTQVSGPSPPVRLTTAERAGSLVFSIVAMNIDPTSTFVKINTLGHSFSENELVYITNIPDAGPSELNDIVYTITGVTESSFQLLNITSLSVSGTFSGQATEYSGIRTNETMSIVWQPSEIECDVAKPTSQFVQFHPQYIKVGDPIDVVSVSVNSGQNVELSLSSLVADSNFLPGDKVEMQNLASDAPHELKSQTLYIHETTDYGISLKDINTLNGSISFTFTAVNLTVSHAFKNVSGTNPGTACHHWHASNSRKHILCIMELLTPNTWIQFRVREICSDSGASSDFSERSKPIKTLASFALPPLNVNPGPFVSRTSMGLSWAGDDSSCVSSGSEFLNWKIELREVEKLRGVYMAPHYDIPWRGIEGDCDNGIYKYDSTSCVAPGLLYSSKYAFRVSEICTDSGLSSGPSNTNELVIATDSFCDPGYRTNPVKRDSCVACVAGMYSSEFGQDNCKNCENGRFATNMGMAKCAMCSPGKHGVFNETAGYFSCALCKKTEYNDEFGVPYSPGCKACPHGRMADVRGLAKCKNCAVGKYQPASAEIECIRCSIGLFADIEGMSECVPCSKGTVGPSQELSKCIGCVPGKYMDEIGSTDGSCKECDTGKSAPSNNSHICTSCLAGRFAQNTSSIVCSLCLTGQSQSTSTSSNCVSCPKGRFTNIRGSTGCTNCPTGRTSPKEGSTECTLCPGGKYNNIPGASTDCLICVSGKDAPFEGATECRACKAGRFHAGASGTEAEPCQVCALGQVAKGTGNSECETCLPGKISKFLGGTYCTECSVGFYTDQAAQSECKICSAQNKHSNFPNRDDVYQDETGQSDCKICSSGRAAPGSSSCITDCTCSAGSYRDQDNKCADCPFGMQCVGDSTDDTPCDCSEGSATAPLGNRYYCPVGTSAQNQLVVLDGHRITTSIGASDCDDKVGINWCSCTRGAVALCEMGRECTCGESRKCPAGKFSSRTGMSECRKCEAGQYQNELGKTECKVCPKGYKCPYGAPVKFDCFENYTCISAALDKWDTCVQRVVNREQNHHCDDVGDATSGILSIAYTECDNATILGGGEFKGAKGNLTAIRGADICPRMENINYFCKDGVDLETAIPAGSFGVSCDENHENCDDKCQSNCNDIQGCLAGEMCNNGRRESCSVGKYAEGSGNAICLSCPPGKITNVIKQAVCLECQKGQFSPISGGSVCDDCPAGYAADLLGSVSCDACVPGRYSAVPKAGSCDGCPLGKFSSSENSTMCTQCRDGTETPGIASPECLLCPKGKYSVGGLACKSCKINEFQPDPGRTVCENCRCGKVSAVGSSACKEPVSRDELAVIKPPQSMVYFAPQAIRIDFNPLEQLTGTLIFYLIEWSSTIQDGVPDFSATCSGNAIVVSKFCEADVVSKSEAVSDGKTVYFEVDWDKDKDDYTKFSPQAQSMTLEEAMKITHPVAVRTSTSSKNCFATMTLDHYLHSRHFFFRLVAVVEWLDSSDEKDYIVRAESDPYSIRESFTWPVRVDCVDQDEYLETRDVNGPSGCIERGMEPICQWKELIDPFVWRCERCPYGGDCKGQPAWMHVKALFGFWRNKNFTGITRFHRCPVPQGCLGSNNPAFVDLYIMNGTDNLAVIDHEERCHSEMGYSGPSCAVCRKGEFYMTASGCRTCEGKSGGSIVLSIATMVGVGLAGAYFIYKFRSLAIIAKDIQKVTKLVINFLQVMTSIKSVYTLEIPSMNIGFSMSAYFEVFSFDFVAIFGFPCLYEMTYFEKYAADMSMLIGFGVFILVVYAIGLVVLTIRSKRKKKKGIDPAAKARLEEMMAMGGGKGMLSMFKNKNPGGKVTGLNRWANVRKGFRAVSMFRSQKLSAKVTLQSRAMAVGFQWFMFQHQPTSVKTFNMVKCEYLDGIYMLRQDYRRICGGGEYVPYFMFAMVVIGVYIVGLPTFIAIYLVKNKRNLADPVIRSKVGFLYVNYKPSSFLWEVQILAHKCLLTGALVVMYQYAIVQCTLAFVIAILSHSMHALYSPFRINLLNKIQHCCLFATSVAFVGNLAFQCAVNNKMAEDNFEETFIRNTLVYTFVGALFLAFLGTMLAVSRSVRKYNVIMKEKKLERKKKREAKRKAELKRTGQRDMAHKKVFGGKDDEGKTPFRPGQMRRIKPRTIKQVYRDNPAKALQSFHVKGKGAGAEKKSKETKNSSAQKPESFFI
jgi:hypothetical protein